MALPAVHPLQAGYVAAFGTAAVACFVAAVRARRIGDDGTRRGLVALLVASGCWAGTHVAYLAVPVRPVAVAVYVLGLLAGVCTVGAWLYFCSAYTGRAYHRDRRVRWAAVAVFLVVAGVKVTNPVHGRYFTTEFVATPFPHVAVHHRPVHWVVVGVSYVLVAVGYFVLLELFGRTNHGRTPLAALVGVTGLPVALDVAGAGSDLLVDVPYEPLGVAAFAVGLLYVYRAEFRAARLVGTRGDPALLLDDGGRVREYNDGARDLLDPLDGHPSGEPLEGILPAVADRVGGTRSVLAVDRDGDPRYYRVSTEPCGAEGVDGVVAFTDVTHPERYRRELERRNDRLRRFASTVTHDLRNPLEVARVRVEFAREDSDSEHLAGALGALDHMETVIDDVFALVQERESAEGGDPVAPSAIAEDAWRMVETDGADLEVRETPTVLADPDRLQRLLENLLANAVDHGGETVRVGPVGDGFYVADDGPGIPEDERSRVFESGYTTDPDGTGYGLAIVEEIVAAHGWEIRVTESSDGGARFEVTGVARPG